MVGTSTESITDNPDPKHVSTSYAEDANLMMRMSLRRFTRLTNAFSKKLDNHAHWSRSRPFGTTSCAFTRRSGCRSNGRRDRNRLWSMEDAARLSEPQTPAQRGSYKPRQSKSGARFQSEALPSRSYLAEHKRNRIVGDSQNLE